MDTSQIIEWKAPAFRYHKKGFAWYWNTLIISFFVLVLAVWQKNFFIISFIVLAELMLIVWAKRVPQIIKFRVNDEGIAVSNNFSYNYSDLEAFAIDTSSEDFDDLALRKSDSINPYIKILVEKDKTLQLKEILLLRLSEEEYQESLLERIGEWLGF